jgi:phospho-N-acetylmuramoyl-pentapeptide-transferase
MLYNFAEYIHSHHEAAFRFVRVFTSYTMLVGIGTALAFFLSVFLLPKFWHLLPSDRGRILAIGGDASKGKPTGAGLIFVFIAIFVMMLTVPLTFQSWYLWGLVFCMVLAMLSGYFDDASKIPWGEKPKLLMDIGIALLAAWVISCRPMEIDGAWHFTLIPQKMTIWAPFIKQVDHLGLLSHVPQGLMYVSDVNFDTLVAPGEPKTEIICLILSPWLYIPMATALLLLSINATNCSDGVDNLAGMLSLMALVYLGIFLYAVVGHEEFSRYLLIPHHAGGPRWAIMIFCVIGALCGYLWHNAFPSAVLMGDGGSRFLGLLIGISVLLSQNPLMIFAVSPMILVNGGTGLVKLLTLRMLRRLGFDTTPPHQIEEKRRVDPRYQPPPQIVLVKALHSVRFPLHDHFRKNKNWSPAQVVVRFLLIQALLTPLLFLLLVKLR